MSTQSVVRVEFIVSGTAYELCAVGGWFEKSWKIRSTQDLHEPPPGYLAADAWFYPLGAATAEITFAIEEEFSSHSAAQAAFNDPDLFGGVSLLAAGTGPSLFISAGAPNLARSSRSVMSCESIARPGLASVARSIPSNA